MQIRVNRATSSLVAFLVAFFALAANVCHAQDSFRIERPNRSQAAAPLAKTQNAEAPPAQAPPAKTPPAQAAPVSASPADARDSECQSPCCSPSGVPTAGLTSALPAEGLYARWQAEFINPTVCPVRLCHGSCKRSSVSCKTVKTKIDSLLDAYIPEEVPVEALLNFRCCAGFTDD